MSANCGRMAATVACVARHRGPGGAIARVRLAGWCALPTSAELRLRHDLAHVGDLDGIVVRANASTVSNNLVPPILSRALSVSSSIDG